MAGSFFALVATSGWLSQCGWSAVGVRGETGGNKGYGGMFNQEKGESAVGDGRASGRKEVDGAAGGNSPPHRTVLRDGCYSLAAGFRDAT